ncbi:ketosteroid isomerase-like protein [Sphingobium sp. B2D3B]|nr:ketosteroid isomerase-like protein [Sphingobium sp. B2D3B]MCW2399109.1 ketosteroid isomerase-like protein [Sphingobium sp. B2D3C]
MDRDLYNVNCVTIPGTDRMTTPTDLPIRARRAAFNRAIADGDAQAIDPILGKDCVMVTGTDSAVIAGRAAQLRVWQREFASPSRLVYERIPAAITVSPVEPIALEQGEWRGVGRERGALAASGVYTAKWREVAGQWVIEAEIFVTLA